MHDVNSAREPTLLSFRIDADADPLALLLRVLEELEESTALVTDQGELVYRSHALSSLLSSEPDSVLLLEAARQFGVRCLSAPVSTIGGRAHSAPQLHFRTTTMATYSVRAIRLVARGNLRSQVILLIRRAAVVLPSPASVRVQFGLTAREAEVAVLLAKGASDADVAQTLGVSIHTARHHAERVFAKVGIHSRKALVLHFA